MFKYFWLRFALLVTSFLFFLGSLIFLAFNHNDTLQPLIPAEADLYLHTKIKQLLAIPPNQQAVYFPWLEQHSALSRDVWRTISQNYRGEIGLFSINNQVFGIANAKKKLLATLKSQGIDFVLEDKAVFFPALRLSDKKITAHPWFNSQRRKIIWGDIIIYIKDLSSLPINTPPNKHFASLLIRANISSAKIKLSINGPVGQQLETTQKRQLRNLPSDFMLYFDNILTQNIPEKAEFLPENISFHLLNTLKGPVEFLKTTTGFVIFASAQNNTLNEVTQNILMIVSQTLPTEIKKLLPDKTLATQFIADKSKWIFKNVNDNNQQIIKLEEEKINLSLNIEQTDEIITIKNNYQQSAEAALAKISGYLNSCSLFHNKGAVLLPLNQETGLNNIIIINKKSDNLVVCIR